MLVHKMSKGSTSRTLELVWLEIFMYTYTIYITPPFSQHHRPCVVTSLQIYRCEMSHLLISVDSKEIWYSHFLQMNRNSSCYSTCKASDLDDQFPNKFLCLQCLIGLMGIFPFKGLFHHWVQIMLLHEVYRFLEHSFAIPTNTSH